MEDKYMKQIQEFIKNNNIQSDSNENISINKNQLLECFKMLENSKNQSKITPNDNIINEIKENNVNNHLQYNESEKRNICFPTNQRINNIDDMPLHSQNNKKNQFNKKHNIKNIDNISFPSKKSKNDKFPIKPNIINIDDMSLPTNKNKFNNFLNKEEITNIHDIPLLAQNKLNNEFYSEKKISNFDDIPIRGKENKNNKLPMNENIKSSDNHENNPFSSKQNATNLDNMPLPALKDKKVEMINDLSGNKNNEEEIPIKGGYNFNDILEKELSKEKNNEYENNENKIIEPKFKYIPKKKRDIVTAPTNTKIIVIILKPKRKIKKIIKIKNKMII